MGDYENNEMDNTHRMKSKRIKNKGDEKHGVKKS
jgi:hypothetical protein